MKFKKAISPVVATALLIVVAVVSVVGFQTWFGTFSSQIFSNVETQSNNDANIQIETLIDGMLYLKNTGTENITISSIKVENTSCTINVDYAAGISEINLTSCLESFDKNIYEIVIYTNNGVFSEKLFLEEYSAPAIPSDPYFSYVVYLSNFETDSSDVKGNIIFLNNDTYVTNGTLILDATDDYLQANGTSTNLTIGNNSFVMEAFFSIDNGFGGFNYPYIIGNEDSQGGADGFMLYYEPSYPVGSKIRLCLNGGGANILLFDEALFQINTTHHIAIVGNSTEIYLYFDGTKIATSGATSYNFIYNQLNLGGNLESVGGTRLPSKKFYAARLTIGSTRGYEGASITIPDDPFLEQ